jgi:hypothetical protein
MPQYDSRKFIDLILSATSKWANWDPPKPINVGDYGTISRKTGEFKREGNIYSDHFLSLLDKSMVKTWPDLKEASLQPKVSKGDHQLIISSSGVHAAQAKVAANVDVQGQVRAGLHINFKFGDKGGAILVLHRPEHSSFPNDVNDCLTGLLKAAHNTVRDKYLVTEVISCPAYMLAMSNEKSENISASLSAAAVNPIATGSVEAGLAWTSDTVNGLYRSGSDAVFTPLYKLSRPRRSFWSFLYPGGHRGDASDGDTLQWEDVRRPWDSLDAHGNEIARYDPAAHPDSDSGSDSEGER